MHERYSASMAHTIQIRDVSDHAYTVMRTRAAAEGLSLSGYLRRQIETSASKPTMAELLERADRRRARGGHTDGQAISEAIAASREELEDR
jgi:hypothetical protein